MSYIIQAKNVNDALGEGLSLLKKVAVTAPSRNGEVLVAPGPVITEYANPKDRVLFSPLRDANPFFHLMEALWMLGGHNDVAWPQQFNSKFGLYSDDGRTVHGAYGHRWRYHFGQDQIGHIIRMLKTDPTTRRAVLTMWHPEGDLWQRGTAYPASGVDLPCNTHIYFSIGLLGLDMTVCCRSNDIIWGAYGANAVHMSILQEYIATVVGVPVGTYFQFSNNYHAYTNILAPEKYQEMIDSAYDYDYYGYAEHRNDWAKEEIVTRVPLISVDWLEWRKDLDVFLAQAQLPGQVYSDPFFNHVAQPMLNAWRTRKNKVGDGLDQAGAIVADDWRVACIGWIARRIEKEIQSEETADATSSGSNEREHVGTDAGSAN